MSNCIGCSIDLGMNAHRNRRRCPDCRQKQHNELGRKRNARLKAEREAERATLATMPGHCPICDEWCLGEECQDAAACASRASARLVAVRGSWDWRDSVGDVAATQPAMVPSAA
jgi:hypothetical protein